MAHTITGQADYIAASVTRGVIIDIDEAGAEVTVSSECLDELAALPSDADGHFDGRHVWIGGTEYEVRQDV
jgi:hypothetical protein